MDNKLFIDDFYRMDCNNKIDYTKMPDISNITSAIDTSGAKSILIATGKYKILPK